MIKIYNSLTRKKEEFIPLKPPKVNMYTCGVTVYDECHIGHARSLYIFDVIRRYLEYKKFKVNFVRNITDIDDKIINRANELKMDWKDLVKKYIEKYYEDLKALGIDKADVEPRATENIPDMIKYIKGLIDKGYAYITDSGVYFSIRKFRDYGKLSGQGIDQMLSGARVEPNEKKQDPLDFALWKGSKENEPFWNSPWGNGRPGWHIECSVMSQKFLKTDTLDIHAGGRDLIFPHHENEIAQAEALCGKPFAKYWLHHGLLTINEQKMAKSLGNFITVKDFIKKYRDPDYLKLIFLNAHYRHPVDYSEEKIEEMKKEKERFRILLEKIKKITNYQLNKEDLGFRTKFEEAMDDDFNTPIALASLFDLVTYINKIIHEKDKFSNDEIKEISGLKRLLLDLSQIFSLNLSKEFYNKDIDKNEILKLIDEREKARSQKDFKKADDIRKRLSEMGIILEDTNEGTGWRRKI